MEANRQCQECGGWELGDGTEDADFNPCRCDEVIDTGEHDAGDGDPGPEDPEEREWAGADGVDLDLVEDDEDDNDPRGIAGLEMP